MSAWKPAQAVNIRWMNAVIRPSDVGLERPGFDSLGKFIHNSELGKRTRRRITRFDEHDLHLHTVSLDEVGVRLDLLDEVPFLTIMAEKRQQSGSPEWALGGLASAGRACAGGAGRARPIGSRPWATPSISLFPRR